MPFFLENIEIKLIRAEGSGKAYNNNIFFKILNYGAKYG